MPDKSKSDKIGIALKGRRKVGTYDIKKREERISRVSNATRN